MTEKQRFDPVGWFVSTCFTVLAGAVALALAIHLLEAIWLGVVALLGVAAVIASLVLIAVWWNRRRPW